jgi:hypothetical protein
MDICHKRAYKFVTKHFYMLALMNRVIVTFEVVFDNCNIVQVRTSEN